MEEGNARSGWPTGWTHTQCGNKCHSFFSDHTIMWHWPNHYSFQTPQAVLGPELDDIILPDDLSTDSDNALLDDPRTLGKVWLATLGLLAKWLYPNKGVPTVATASEALTTMEKPFVMRRINDGNGAIYYQTASTNTKVTPSAGHSKSGSSKFELKEGRVNVRQY